MKKLISLSLVIFIVTGFMLTGCNGSKTQTQTENQATNTTEQKPKEAKISFWYTANEADPTDIVSSWNLENLKLFKEKYPNITIEKTVVSDPNSYLTKLSTAMAANSAPDIFFTWLAERMGPFVQANRLMPLNEVIEGDKEFKEVIDMKNMDMSTFGGKVYAIPNRLTTEVVYYNKDIFNKYNVLVPKTWDDLLNAIKVFKDNGITPMELGNKGSHVGAMTYMMIFERLNGPEKYESLIVNHKGSFTEPEFINAMKKMNELKDAGAFTPNFNSLANSEAKANFMAGKSAMWVMGSWMLSSLVSKDGLGDKVDFFNFPDIVGGKGNSKEHYIIGKDEGYGISAATPEKEAAVQFLKFMFSKERQKPIAESGALISTVNIPYDKSKVSPVTGKMQEALSSAKHGMVPWDNLLGTGLGTSFNDATQLCLAGASIDETFANLDKVAKQQWDANK